MEKTINEKGLVHHNQVAWEELSIFLKNTKPSKIFLLTDNNTFTDCLPYLLKKQPVEGIITTKIAAGEEHKNIATCLKVWSFLLENGADKNSLLINLGGGVVTDLGGFVASTFMRGIPFINIPTSLLSMVDASVGGKNGVDLGHIKNQIGVINLPEMVIIDKSFLHTLPIAHLKSGLAEMFKHGIIFGRNYWDKIKNVDFLNEAGFEELIWEAIAIKNKIVKKDPFEKDLRKTLNFGHTLGHAIESYFLESDTKPTLLHGEAVAIGIILATYISAETMNLSKDTLKEITSILLRHFKKQNFTEKDINSIIDLLVFDKKNRNGKVLFVLLEDIGVCKINCVVDNKLIINAFEYYKIF